MPKKKSMFCLECGKSTPHVYTGSESPFEGAGPARLMIAMTTFGLSETTMRDRFWQCEKCGDIKKR